MTLYEETPCEHGELRDHLLGVLASDNPSQWERCTEGRRQEVTVDVEAAAKWMQADWEADHEAGEFAEPRYEWDDLDQIHKDWWRAQARGAINAALGRTG